MHEQVLYDMEKLIMSERSMVPCLLYEVLCLLELIHKFLLLLWGMDEWDKQGQPLSNEAICHVGTITMPCYTYLFLEI